MNSVIKRHNFEVYVEFNNKKDNSFDSITSNSITILTHRVYTEFLNNKNYINISIMPTIDSSTEEMNMKNVKNIIVYRYDASGKKLLKSIFKKCKCKSILFDYKYPDNTGTSAGNFVKTFKFSYKNCETIAVN